MKKVRFLGLDVHAETIAVAVAEPDGKVRSLGMIPFQGREPIMRGRAGSDRAAHGKEDPHALLCARPFGRTRVSSVRQLPTDHDYAVSTQSNSRAILSKTSAANRAREAAGRQIP
jgi:hypothetical protein